MYNPPTLFGYFLNEERSLRGMSVRSFCDFLGISRDTLLRLLKSTNQPDLNVLLKISQALDINFMTLLILSRPEDSALLVDQYKHPRTINRTIQNLNMPYPVAEALKELADTQSEDQTQEMRDIREAITTLNASVYLLSQGVVSEEIVHRQEESERRLLRLVKAG